MFDGRPLIPLPFMNYDKYSESDEQLLKCASTVEDSEKAKILTYMRLNCIAACPGI